MPGAVDASSVPATKSTVSRAGKARELSRTYAWLRPHRIVPVVGGRTDPPWPADAVLTLVGGLPARQGPDAAIACSPARSRSGGPDGGDACFPGRGDLSG